MTKTEEGKLYALKLYRFYREQKLPPFMAMAAVIDSGQSIATKPFAYTPPFTARVAMSVWAAHQYMQWIQRRMVMKELAGYWFVGRLHVEPNEAIAGMYEEIGDKEPIDPHCDECGHITHSATCSRSWRQGTGVDTTSGGFRVGGLVSGTFADTEPEGGEKT